MFHDVDRHARLRGGRGWTPYCHVSPGHPGGPCSADQPLGGGVEHPHEEENPMADESYTGEAYCVKCKEKRNFTGEVKVSESGRRMAQGICPVCGTKLNRILGKA
jgi:Domain of unknown function (DUF5679)